MSMTRAQVVRGNLVALATKETPTPTLDEYEKAYSPRSQSLDSPKTGCWEFCKSKFTFFFCSETRRKPVISAGKAIQAPQSPAYRSISTVTFMRGVV